MVSSCLSEAVVSYFTRSLGTGQFITQLAGSLRCCTVKSQQTRRVVGTQSCALWSRVLSDVRFLLSRFLIICPGFQTQALVCSQSEHDKIRRKQPRESKLSIIQYPYNPSHSHIDTLTLDELNQTILYLKG